MSYAIHKIVGFFLNPCGITLGLMVVALVLLAFRRRKIALGVLALDIVLTVLMSLQVVADLLALPLEKDYPPVRAEAMAPADAIIVLGGGIAAIPKESTQPYSDLNEAADRAWHGARLWKAQGCALPVYCTSPDVSASTPSFLQDLGVAPECIIPVDGPRNTEEEALALGRMLAGRRALLVTSATHMTRSLLIFRRYAPEVEMIPAATDHIVVDDPHSEHPWARWLPSFDAYMYSGVILHEYLGLVRYWLF